MKSISFVGTGDALITLTQSVHSEPSFMKLVEVIRNADVGITNLEMLLHNYDEDCYPAAECGGTYTRAPPEILDDLIWMGFDIYGTANNHSLDYMYGGLFSTIHWLDQYGLIHAGTGNDLAEARKPAYLDTDKGRIGFISAASSFANFGRAGDARRDMKGRPGLNPLRYDQWYEAKSETIGKIKEVFNELELEEVYQEEESYHFLGNKFVSGETPGIRTKPNKSDKEGNLEAIKDASRQADWVIFSLHAHEGKDGDPEQPAEFIDEFAREAIDAGAHAFLGHGHHAMRGIEIRNGRPIFYSLGNFIFQNETVEKMPADFYKRYDLDPYGGTVSSAFDARHEPKPTPGRRTHVWFTKDEKYWLSILPYMEFEDDALSELKLYPIELGQDKPRSQRGRPMMAEGALADKILNTIKKLSEPYGTEITKKDGIGLVNL